MLQLRIWNNANGEGLRPEIVKMMTLILKIACISMIERRKRRRTYRLEKRVRIHES